MLLAVLGRSPHSLPGAMLALYVRSMAVCPCGTRPDSCRRDAWSHVRFEDKNPLLAVLTRWAPTDVLLADRFWGHPPGGDERLGKETMSIAESIPVLALTSCEQGFY